MKSLSVLLLIGLLFTFIDDIDAVMRRRRMKRGSLSKKYNLEAMKSNLKNKKKVTIESKIQKAKLKQEQSKLQSLSSSSSILKSNSQTTASPLQLASCDEYFYEQRLDHFGSGIGPNNVTTFAQRYYICGKDMFSWTLNNPVFFYCGNEASVIDYIDYTGLMWEAADEFNALLVFAEHRYYGDSLPFPEEDVIENTDYLAYLTTDQALADYADLINYLKLQAFMYSDEFLDQPSHYSPIIGFGGSYGGMLATWFRMKYPQFMDGAIAGSAPILGLGGLDPPCDAYGFSRLNTLDAGVEAGVENGNCQSNIQQGWDDMEELAQSSGGRDKLAAIFNLCSVPEDEETAELVIDVVDEAVAYMGMSMYPYPSDYIASAVLGVDGGGLPAYPVSYACNLYLTDTFETALERVEAIGSFNEVFWNATGDSTCLDLDTLWNSYDDLLWDYLYCDSLFIPDGSLGGDEDMFWYSPWNGTQLVIECNEWFNINVDPNGPASRKYGGRDLYKSMSNIVFTNGELDPWMSGGVTNDAAFGGNGNDASLTSFLIPMAGHHLDLMFSNDADPESVIQARLVEREKIAEWIDQAYEYDSLGMCGNDDDSSDSDEVVVEDDYKKNYSPFITAMSMLM